MDQRKALAKLLRKLADFVENCSTAELDEFIADERKRLRIAVDAAGDSAQHKKKSAGRASEARDWATVVAQLRTLMSRDDGQRLLDELNLTRIELERLARFMDLPVLRQDNSERLREKIIATSIGSRLSSQAIRGANE